MKPFAVVRYRRNDIAGMHTVSATRAREHYVFAQRGLRNDLNDFANDPPDIIWCDDEQSANDTCEKLAQLHVNSCWVKVSSQFVHNNAVIKTAVNKSVFSAAGLLPA